MATLDADPAEREAEVEVVADQSGRSAAIVFAPLASRPIAVLPFSSTLSPLPPVPCPKQVALGLVLTETFARRDRLFGEHLAAGADHAQVRHQALGRCDRREGKRQGQSQRADGRQPERGDSWHLRHPFLEG